MKKKKNGLQPKLRKTAKFRPISYQFNPPNRLAQYTTATSTVATLEDEDHLHLPIMWIAALILYFVEIQSISTLPLPVLSIVMTHDIRNRMDIRFFVNSSSNSLAGTSCMTSNFRRSQRDPTLMSPTIAQGISPVRTQWRGRMVRLQHFKTWPLSRKPANNLFCRLPHIPR